jgi:hypothetical protein
VLVLPAAARTTPGATHGAAITPGSGTRDVDPLVCLRGLGFTQFLRSPKAFSEAMVASHRYDNPEAEARPTDYDPSRATFIRAAARLDAVDLLLERRHWRADRFYDLVRSVHLYSDASPVTEEEIQGMVMDVMKKDDNHRRVTLPGASLVYGNLSAVAKGVTLLWACYLVAGPFFDDMAYFNSKVTGICSDFGTEVHTLEMPDILRAFLQWNAGMPLLDVSRLIDHDHRLWYNAIRVSGWCHCWGNLMKYVAHKLSSWDDHLARMRNLVSFWHNKTWRQYMKKVMQGTGYDTSELNHFSCTMAKWRYETIPAAQSELLRLKTPSQAITGELFPRAQDKVELRRTCEACHSQIFWDTMTYTQEFVFGPCETARRWGMVCECPLHVQARKELRAKHIQCI